MNGILVIDKAPGWTSHDVVARTRRLLHERRVGHAGTLDPMATGVLPVFAGRATRAVEFAADSEKEYIGGLKLGVITDTQDTTGTILEQKPVHIDRAGLDEILPRFRGEILQIPPMYSALKRDGKKLYELARAGQEVEREPRPVTIHALEVLDGPESEIFPEADFVLKIRCSKGTYIRTLCHDIGAALGCGGAMCALRRTYAAGFSLREAVTLEALEAAADRGEAGALLRPVDDYFGRYPALAVDAKSAARIKNGASFSWDAPEGFYRVYGPAGEFLMLGQIKSGRLTTVKSFFEVP